VACLSPAWAHSDDDDLMAESMDRASEPVEDGRYVAECPACKVSQQCFLTGIIEDDRPQVPERNRRRMGRLECPVCGSVFTRYVRWP
jgi:hypothetical protein